MNKYKMTQLEMNEALSERISIANNRIDNILDLINHLTKQNKLLLIRINKIDGDDLLRQLRTQLEERNEL